METSERDAAVIETVKSIESQYRVDHVESGLPRWLIEVAFASYLLQAAINWAPLMHWMEEHAPLASAAIQTFGALVMYFGLMRGMKPLYRPMTVAWWIVIVLNIVGFVPLLFPVLIETVGLPTAVALMLVYLPFGCAIAFCYRGRLRQVGIWMALYILISSIIPVLSYLLVGPESGLANLPMEIPTIAVIVIYAWVQRRVLVK
ncbi:MAG: hypothetical protein J5552_09050 [Prevotella sp.]|nr:hypothetical protein [Prevotella sp.]